MKELREIIESQRKGKEDSPVWMVGEQLLDIAAGEPDSLELLKQDLTVPEMSLEKAEGQIKAWADKHKKGNCCCVSPKVADGILRKFYGLKSLDERKAEAVSKPCEDDYIDLDSFL